MGKTYLTLVYTLARLVFSLWQRHRFYQRDKEFITSQSQLDVSLEQLFVPDSAHGRSKLPSSPLTTTAPLYINPNRPDIASSSKAHDSDNPNIPGGVAGLDSIDRSSAVDRSSSGHEKGGLREPLLGDGDVSHDTNTGGENRDESFVSRGRTDHPLNCSPDQRESERDAMLTAKRTQQTQLAQVSVVSDV